MDTTGGLCCVYACATLQAFLDMPTACLAAYSAVKSLICYYTIRG